MTEKAFRNHPEQRKALDEALNLPVMKTALDILNERNKPRSTVEARAFVPYDTLVAEKHHFARGFQAALDQLQRLTRENPATGDEEERNEPEFFHALSSEMKEAIRKQIAQNQQPTA